MCILLIGGGGFVGTNFLIRMNFNEMVIVVDPAEIRLIGSYIHYKQTIQEFIKQENYKKYEITKIICLAADSFVPSCGRDGFINNIEIAQSVIYLLRYYDNFKFRRLGHENDFCSSIPCLFFITDEVFDLENCLSYCGNHKKFNQSYYSASKFISNELLKNYDICLAYPPNLFGNYQKHDCIIKKILNGKLEFIEDTGEQKRYFMKVGSVVDVMFEWLKNPKLTSEDFNELLFKNPWFKLSINELVEKVFGLTVPHRITRQEHQDSEYSLKENMETQLIDYQVINEYILSDHKKRPTLRRTPSISKNEVLSIAKDCAKPSMVSYSNSSAEDVN